jgi:DNA-binding transcriptional ArsR family regulator
MTLRLDRTDLGQVRFAFSPLWETVMSLRTLGSVDDQAHRPWVVGAARRLAASTVDLPLLTALVRPAGYLPDFLVPSPRTGRPRFRTALDQVAASPPEVVADQLVILAEHDLTENRPWRDERVQLLRRLAGAPATALARIVAELDTYWKVAIEPVWRRVEATLQADLAYRLEQLSTKGLDHLLRSLHPIVSFDGTAIRVEKHWNETVDLGGRGLLLVPCVFAWPDVIVQTAEPHTPTLSYSPRGMALLWTTSSLRDRTALADVLGRTRALLLAALDLPMSTTQLSDQLDLAPPTVNAHLKALAAAGILSSRRDGRAVLYARSPIGDALLRGTLASGSHAPVTRAG